MQMRTYNLFISHSWAYTNGYDRLVEMLNAKQRFIYRNYSVPKNDPIHTNGTAVRLYAAILQKISPCSVVLIMSGVYATYSKWIDQEIQIAKSKFSPPKPVIAIEPWASTRTSAHVKNNADRIVGWNTDSIVNAIRDLAR